jgi:hypothetical protein
MTTIGRIGTVLVLLVIAGGIAGEARGDGTKRNKGVFAGTLLDTRIDINNDGFGANWFTAEAVDSFGRSTLQGAVEAVPTPPTSECPGGLLIVDAANGIGAGASTQTFPNGRDQVYYQFLTRALCLDAAGGFTGRDTGIVAGGAGRFEGVDGAFVAKYSGFFQLLDQDAVPQQGFGSFTLEFESKLNFPGRHHD